MNRITGFQKNCFVALKKIVFDAIDSKKGASTVPLINQ